MKRILFAIALAFTLQTASAQGMVIDKTKMTKSSKLKSDTLVLDKVSYRVTYKTRLVTDTTKTPYNYRDDEMRTDIGETGISKFYSYMTVLHDIALQETVKGGSFDLTNIPRQGPIGWTFFRNYPKQGRTLLHDRAGFTRYQCDEPIETPEWTIVPDSTAELLGYPCQLAVANFKGRTWYAWFTEDIPLDEGPWKLGGLPGLILKAYDAPRQYIFEGAGLEQVDGKEDIVLVNDGRKRENVSQKDLRHAQEAIDMNAEIASMGGKVTDQDGNPIKFPRRPINPIER